MKHLTLLVIYCFTGLMIAIVTNQSIETQKIIADIVVFLVGGITGYVMHDNQGNEIK